MKKNALVVFGLMVSLASAGAVVGQDASTESVEVVVENQAKITVEQARKIALKKVDGKIEGEYVLEDDDENITAYGFIIRDKQGKSFEVEVDAQKGEIILFNEIVDEDGEETTEEATEEDTDSTEPQEEEVEEVESPQPQPEEVEAPEQEEEEVTEAEEAETTETEEVEATEVETVEVVATEADDKAKDTPKVSMEQARAKALKKAKGEIQSEELITEDGKSFYSFVIKTKNDKMVEIRVDANSGKAKKVKTQKTETE